MIRINLLPPEITEKRGWERRWVWVWFGGAAVAIALAIFWFVMFLQVSAKQADVAAKVQQAQSLQAQASAFKVFEDRQRDLKTRQATADRALSGRLDASLLFNDIAIIMPTDAWLVSLHVDQKAFDIKGDAVDSQGDQASMGFKPVAKLLVRMADLRQLENVWLNSASKAQFDAQPVMVFDVSADVSQPVTVTAGSAPAPPSGK